MMGKGMTCPTERQLSRHSVLSDDQQVGRHVGGCPRCAALVAELGRPGAIAREIPTPPLGAETRRRLRARLQRVERGGAALTSPARWLLPWLAPVVLAAAVALFALSRWPTQEVDRRPGPVARKGLVQAMAGARFALLGDLPDEIVRLEEGTITVTVAPLAPGERFRVITGDGEVAVRGTAFDVTARGDRLTAVRVLHGRVEVTAAKGARASLGAGERWLPPASVPPPRAIEAVPPSRRAPPVRARERAAVVSARPPSRLTGLPGERQLADGWTALKAGQPAGAAAAFEEAARAAGDSALAEDAWFWHAVALARADQPGAARAALGRFLARYPRSARAGEASVMLGWLLLDAGESTAARNRFQTAVQDPVRAVRDSAREGLRASAR